MSRSRLVLYELFVKVKLDCQTASKPGNRTEGGQKRQGVELPVVSALHGALRTVMLVFLGTEELEQ